MRHFKTPLIGIGLLSAIWPLHAANPDGASTSSLQPIVIQAQRDPATIGEVAVEQDAGNFTLIPRQRFQHRQTSVAEVIESETGIQVRQSGGLGSYSTVSLRGASEQQVMVFIDGLPLNQSAGGGVDLGRLDLAQVEAIEIYRGRTPIQFGVATPGGAINIRTRRAQSDSLSRSIETGIGSFGAHSVQYDQLGSSEYWDHALVLHGQRSDNNFDFVNKNRPFDPSDPNRERAEPRQNAQSERTGLLARLGYKPNQRQRIEGSFNWFDQAQGLPSFNNSRDSRTQLDTSDQLLQLRWSGYSAEPAAWEHRLRLFIRNLQEDFDDRASQVGLGSQQTHDETLSAGTDLFLSRPFGAHRLSGSFGWQHEDYQSEDRQSGQDSAKTQRQTLTAAGELALSYFDGRLTLSPALRALQFSDEIDGDESFDDSFITPQIGLQYLLNPAITLSANAGRYVRIPSFFEQFGDRGFIVGNPSLKAETSNNFDVGIEWLQFYPDSLWLNRSRVELNAFASDIDDAIVYVFDARGVGRALNIGEAQILGTELALELALRSATRIELDITLQDPQNEADIAAFNGKNLPGRYSEAYNLRIEQWLGSITRVFYRYHGERGLYYDSANLLAAKDRDEHDVGLQLHWQHWRASIEARNLKDENFQAFNGFPEPGRSFWASLGYTFR